MTENGMTNEAYNIQDRVLEIVQSTLLNNSIKMEDNIFAVGGDSLTLLEICSELESEFDFEIPLELVWSASSIVEFAAIVERCLASDSEQRLRSGT